MFNFRIAITALAMSVAGISANADVTPEFLNSGSILPTNLPFSEAVIVGDTVYLSGQVGNIPGKLELAPGGVEGESRQVLENIQTSLRAHGMEMSNLVKCTVILADIGDWGTFNEIYVDFFEAGRFPARAAFASSGLALGAKVEVDCIGAK